MSLSSINSTSWSCNIFNFYAATFGVLLNSGGISGLTTFSEFPASTQILILAQLMYGYGYVTTFAFEYEKTGLGCGLPHYEQVRKITIVGAFSFFNFNLTYTMNIKIISQYLCRLNTNILLLGMDIPMILQFWNTLRPKRPVRIKKLFTAL